MLLSEIKQPFLILFFYFTLLLSSCAIKPPNEKGDFKKSDLVELVKLDPNFKLDIRYASDNNFVGRPVYNEARAFLQRSAALQLVEASKELKTLGYGLLIFDGYRP